MCTYVREYSTINQTFFWLPSYSVFQVSRRLCVYGKYCFNVSSGRPCDDASDYALPIHLRPGAQEDQVQSNHIYDQHLHQVYSGLYSNIILNNTGVVSRYAAEPETSDSCETRVLRPTRTLIITQNLGVAVWICSERYFQSMLDVEMLAVSTNCQGCQHDFTKKWSTRRTRLPLPPQHGAGSMNPRAWRQRVYGHANTRNEQYNPTSIRFWHCVAEPSLSRHRQE